MQNFRIFVSRRPGFFAARHPGMQFKEIIGQEEIKRHLRETVRNGRISHAMLFSGGEGVGALPLALAYAQYVNCRNRTNEDSCGVCPECYRMQRMEHPDCHYIYPVNTSKEAVATGRADEKPRSEQFLHVWRRVVPETGGYLTEQEWYAALGIENQQGIINKNDANELVRQMGFKAFEGGYKTVIVWLPERLHEAAANTLLKLVEEPPEKTLFLFVSIEPERIMATIRSRTQIVALPGVPDDIVARELIVRQGVAAERAELLAHLAQGSWGAAVRLAKAPDGQGAGGQRAPGTVYSIDAVVLSAEISGTFRVGGGDGAIGARGAEAVLHGGFRDYPGVLHDGNRPGSDCLYRSGAGAILP